MPEATARWRRRRDRPAERAIPCGALLLGLLLGTASSAAAQQRAPLLPQWELQGALVNRRDPSVEVGVGLNIRTGSYVRVGAMLASGLARSDGAGNPTLRLDATVRYLLDPFSEGRWGLYGGGGITLSRDARDEQRASILLVAGIEAARAPRWTPSLELGLGGGVRLAAVWRSRRPGRSR